MKLGKHSDKSDKESIHFFRNGEEERAFVNELVKANIHLLNSEGGEKLFISKLKANGMKISHAEFSREKDPLKIDVKIDITYATKPFTYKFKIGTFSNKSERQIVDQSIIKIISSLRFILPLEDQEEIKGDLIEIVHRMVKEKKTKWWIYFTICVQFYSIFNYTWSRKKEKYFSKEKEKEVGR